MTTPHMEGLHPRFVGLVEQLLELCGRDELPMRPYFGVRDPFTQARFWRQSRTTAEVESAIEALRRDDAPHLAACLESVGPQSGRWLTNALPGFSWHQWGEAVDCFAVNGQGGADWKDGPAYENFARRARGLGLKPGRDFGDSPHVQLSKNEIPAIHRPAAVDRAMALKFPDLARLEA